MHGLIEGIRRHAGAMDGLAGQPRFAVVTSVDPVNHLAKVNYAIAPGETVVSGWLPVLTGGSGWQHVPQVGDQVFVVPDMGDAQNGVIVGMGYSTPQPPPQAPNALGTGGTPSTTDAPVVAGEILFVHRETGTALRFLAGGGIYVRGDLLVDGNIVVNGDVSDRHGSLDRLRQAYNAHRHTGVQAGGGTSGTTDHVDPE